MNLSTITLTVNKEQVDPLLLQDALIMLLHTMKVEVEESSVSNITEEENREYTSSL